MAGTTNPNDAWLSGETGPSSFYPQELPHPSATPSSGFQDLIDRANRATAVCDRELRYLAVNWRWKKDFALEDRNLVGQKHGDLFPYLGTRWEDAVRSVLQGHPEGCPQDEWVLPSNRPAWVSWHLEPWTSKRGAVGGFTITCDLLGPEARDPIAQVGYSLRGSSNPFVRTDLQGRILECNAAARAWAFSGFAPENHPCFWDAFCLEKHREAVRIRFLQGIEESLREGQFCVEPIWSQPFFPSLFERNDVTWSAQPLLDEKDRINGIFWVGLSIPKAPDPLPSPPGLPPLTEASLAQILELAPFGLVLLDSAGRAVFANHEHASLLGLDLRSHASIDDWLRSACPHGQDPEKLVQAWKQSVWQDESACSFALRTPDHRLRHIRFHPRRVSDGGLLLSLLDVTGFQQKLDLLQDAEANFRSLFRHAQIGLALENPSGTIVQANAACYGLTHRSPDQLRGQSFLGLIHAEDRPAVQSRIAEIRKNVVSPATSLDVRLISPSSGGEPRQDASSSFVRLLICGIPGTSGELLHFAYFLTDVAIERL